MKQTLINFFIVLMSLGLFLVFIKTGLNNARLEEESKMVYKNTLAAQSALEFFSNDYDRFPSAVEFGKAEVMLSYLSIFPPREFISAPCQKNWVYARPTPSSYVLDFCVPKETENLSQGWHKLVGSLK